MFNREDSFKKIYNDFMNINKVKDIIKEGLDYLAVAQYLYTVSNGMGLLLSTPHNLATELNVSERKMKTILNKLQELDFIKYNSKEGIIWIIDMLYYTSIDANMLEGNRGQVRLYRRYLSELPNTSEIKQSIYEYYKDKYGFLFTTHIESKVNKVKKVNKVQSFVDVYDILIEGKGKKKGYLSKNVRRKIDILKNEYNVNADILRDYALNNSFIGKYSNLSELLDIIIKDLFVAELDTDYVENKEDNCYNSNESKESEQLPEDIFESKDEENKEDDTPATQEDIAKLEAFFNKFDFK